MSRHRSATKLLMSWEVPSLDACFVQVLTRQTGTSRLLGSVCGCLCGCVPVLHAGVDVTRGLSASSLLVSTFATFNPTVQADNASPQ